MKITPIPNELLGDCITLILPTENGSFEKQISNVRVERSEKISNNTRGTCEITVWVDRQLSTWAEFPTGARVAFGGEIFEITESKVYRAPEEHHCKFKATKIGDESE